MTQCQEIYLNLRTQLYRCYVRNHHWWILSNDHLNSSDHPNSSHHHLEIWNHPAPTRSHLHIHNISPANEVPQNWSTACFLITSNNLQTMPTFPSKLMKSAWRHTSPCQIKPREGYGNQPMTTVGLCFARKLQPNRQSRNYNVLQLR
jgi:hypothetical protein